MESATLDDHHPDEVFEGSEEKHFNWLRRSYRGSTFVSYWQYEHLPSCSLEWGQDGYGGCCNHGGELLYLSAPSVKEGLIMARGHFSTSLYSALSRAQIDFGGPSTFGLEVAYSNFAYDPSGQKITMDNEADHEKEKGALNGSSFRLGAMIDRGFFNYRWPLTEYYIDEHPLQKAVNNQRKSRLSEASGDDEEESDSSEAVKHIGTCQMFSFVKDSVFYQVLRLEEGGQFDLSSPERRQFPHDSQLVITMGGPVWFQKMSEQVDHTLNTEGRQNKTMAVASGPDSQGSASKPSQHNLEDYREDTDAEADAVDDISVAVEGDPSSYHTIRYYDKGHKLGLEARIYHVKANGCDVLPLTKSYTDKDSGPADVQGDCRVTAYNALYKFEGLPGREGELTPPTPRCVIIMAAIRLFEGKLDDEKRQKWDPLPKSETIFEHIGGRASSSLATGPLWQGLFLDWQKRADPPLNVMELNMIGRSIEKILQVDMIPITIGNGKSKGSYAALVSNVFIGANIDLKSMFWKTRLLVRVFKFLTLCQQRGLDASRSTSSDTLEAINGQLTRIQDGISQVIRYLVKALLEIDEHKDSGPHRHMMPNNSTAGESNYYYVMITLWYVVNEFPEWKWDWKDSISTYDWTAFVSKARLFRSSRLPPDNWAFARADKDKVTLLQWYHYGSLLRLCEAEIFPAAWKTPELELKVARLASLATVHAAVKMASQQDYVPDDEVFDRLSFLAEELALEGPVTQDPNHVGSVASLTMKRIKRREFSRSLNAGWLPPTDRGPTMGPWEIHVLCHHSRLVVLMLEEKGRQDWRANVHTREESEAYRRKIRSFMNAEGTLIPCWERAHAQARKGFLRSETTAVVVTSLTTILDKLTRNQIEEPKVKHERTKSGESGEIRNAGLQIRPAQHDQLTPERTLVQLRSIEKSLKRLDDRVLEETTQSSEGQKRLLMEFIHMQALMDSELEVFEKFTTEASQLPPIQWITFRLPCQSHPQSFFASLEDTPERYRGKELAKVSVPISVRDYDVRLPQDMAEDEMEFTKKEVLEIVPTQCLALFDIRAKAEDPDDDGFTWKIRQLQYRGSTLEELKQSIKELSWALYDNLVDQEVQHRFLLVRRGNKWNLANAGVRLADFIQKKDTDNYESSLSPVPRQPPLTLEELLPQPSRANVRIPGKVLEFLIYVAHQESAPCLGNHLLKFSRFSCHRRETWVASITLRSWRALHNARSRALKREKARAESRGPNRSGLRRGSSKPDEAAESRRPSAVQFRDPLTSPPNDENADIEKLHVENPDDDPILLPMTLKKAWTGVVHEDLTFELEVSSVILSTNSFGDFSQCTLISDLLTDGEVSKVVMDARELWQKFVHQPQTARCLAFLLVLGKLCAQITMNYEGAIEELTAILKLDTSFATTEQVYSDEKYPFVFRLGVWSLEALYKLQHSLSSTLESLTYAREDLLSQIQDGPGRRSMKLERMCQEYIAEFENNLLQLIAVNARLDRRIKLNTRYKDASSSVFTMEASRMGLKQNDLALEQNRYAADQNRVAVEQSKLSYRQTEIAIQQSTVSLSQSSTIQRLTYLTIAYLPAALIASVFNIGDSQNVLNPSMGIGWFVGAIFILTTITFLMAFFKPIINFFRYPPKLMHTGPDGRPVVNRAPNLWRIIFPESFPIPVLEDAATPAPATTPLMKVVSISGSGTGSPDMGPRNEDRIVEEGNVNHPTNLTGLQPGGKSSTSAT